MIEASAPGKLFIAGEYAVVEPGQPAVLVAVDRTITVRLSGREAEGAGSARSESDARDYVSSAIATVERLRSERGIAPRAFDLDISSELDDASGRKFGLGSSAAVTVAVVAALDEFYGLDLTLAERFKLAMLASIEVAPRGSGGDLAASVFGGWIRYTSPDREALRLHRAEHGVAATMDSDAWAGCGVRRLPAPEGLQLLVGWTGSPASTERLVARSRRAGAAPPAPGFLDDSRACVDALVAACEGGGSAALDAIRRARRLLQEFGAASGVEVETDQLRALCDAAERHGAAGKPSGAGGGDCGIVLTPADPSRIVREWEAHGIRRLDLSVHPPQGGIDEF